MAQINQDRYETLAARVLGVKGAGIFGHAEDAVFAGLALDTNAPIEFWYTQRIYRYGMGRYQAGAAGSTAGFEIRNTTVDQLWVIEDVSLTPYTNAGVALWVGEGTTSDFYATTLLATQLDTRIPATGGQDFGSQGTGLATPPGYGRLAFDYCPTLNRCQWEPGVILAPGGSFIANIDSASIALFGTIRFHTRQAMPGELS